MPKKNTPTAEIATKYEPTTDITVTKDQAGKVMMGERVSIVITGEVAGISERNYSDPKTWSITLKKSKVSNIGVNQADRSMRRMNA